MANEQLKESNEQGFSPEALADERADHQERLREDVERNAEKGHESLEDARKEVEQAATHEKAAAQEEKLVKESAEASPAERRRAPISRKEKTASFNKTMKEVQGQMPPSSRAFSKVIHNKVVEATSEAIGNTVARPNAILAGSMSAFLFTVVILLVAKYYGYPLSGFETIAAFILGWIVGIIFDFLKVMITGKRP